MALILTFSKAKQASDNPQVVVVHHKGEKMYLIVTADGRLIVDGAKTFKIDRTTVEDLKKSAENK